MTKCYSSRQISSPSKTQRLSSDRIRESKPERIPQTILTENVETIPKENKNSHMNTMKKFSLHEM